MASRVTGTKDQATSVSFRGCRKCPNHEVHYLHALYLHATILAANFENYLHWRHKRREGGK